MNNEDCEALGVKDGDRVTGLIAVGAGGQKQGGGQRDGGGTGHGFLHNLKVG